jgi:NDP-sugar pyrophosphorylase family protein
MSKRAVILAGGKGTRLRPYTVVLPKPLMPIGEFPILEVIIRQLVRSGFDHVTMAVNHQAEIIKAFFQDGAKWGIKIDYSLEHKPLGTMAPLRLINDLPENFLVMNGDILTDLDYAEFYAMHVKENRIFTISSYMREQLVDYGVLETRDGQLLSLIEKPRMTYEVSMGVYMMAQRTIDEIPCDAAFGFDDLMHALVKKKLDIAVRKFSGYWLDIGRPDDYAQAIDEFDSMRARFIGG